VAAGGQPGLERRSGRADQELAGDRPMVTMGPVMASGRPLPNLSRRLADSGDRATRSRASATRARPLAYCS
jgi:hypothetical protein